MWRYLFCIFIFSLYQHGFSEETNQEEKPEPTLKWIAQSNNIKTNIQDWIGETLEDTIEKTKSEHEKFGSRLRRDVFRGEDSPLHLAVKSRDLRKVKELLKMGYDVNLGGFEGKTPLGLAAEKGYDTIVIGLLWKNASIDKRDFFEDAPIHYAAYNGKLDIVEILLDHGANINSKGKFGETALHIAARKGYENIVDLLISRNASLDLINNFDSGVISDPRYILSTTEYHSIDNGNFGETPLHMAARNGHQAIVNLLLSNNASLDIKNQLGITPLYLAVIQKDLNVVKTLINYGANVNVKGSNGMTPLMVAAVNGDEAIVNLLISKNATLDTKDDSHNAAIHYAALSGNLTVVNALLDHGADANTKGSNGKTPLNFAVRTKKKVIKRYLEEESSTGLKKKFKEMIWVNTILENEIFTVMKSLLKHGAKVNSRDILDQTVLHEAAALGYPGIVGYLASEGANFSMEDYLCFTPLQWAVYNGNVDVIRTLFKYGDDINRKGCNNVTALHLAITANNTDIINFLLSNNADPNVMSEDGRTPLDVAFQTSSEEYLKFLLNHGAKLEDYSFLGSKVLFDAVAKNSLDVLHLLLDSAKNIHSYPTVILNYAIRNNFYDGVHQLISFGADVQRKDIHGNLPLSSAVMSKNLDLVKLILETATYSIVKDDFQAFLDANSDVKFVVNDSESNYGKIVEYREFAALHIASKLGLTDVAKMLISYNASSEVKYERGYTPLHCACEEGHVEVVKLLLNSGANKDSSSFNGTTPLHIACRRNQFEIVELLLTDPPAAINVSDDLGYTALHFVALSGSLQIGKLLLKLGADIEANTKDLKTPLHFASMEGHKETVNILLNSGADNEAADINGMTPLHFAARNRYSDVVDLILRSGAVVNTGNENGSTPLHLACGSNSKPETDVVRLLVIYGANVDQMDDNRMTPLHVASRDNSSGCVEILLREEADLFCRDLFFNQPIHYAALNGHYKIVLMLLTNEKGIILGMSVNNKHETPLILASREGHTDVAALLLQVGVESFQPDATGRTALHRSASRGHLEIVKLLRQGLLNMEKTNKWGFTALNYAASWRGHQEVIGYLSTTQLNITLSQYLNKSNPIQQNVVEQKSLKLTKLHGITLGLPFSFIEYSDSINK